MKYILLFILVGLSSCGSQNKTPNTCDNNFEAFFERFKSDSTFQKSHVDFPIMNYYTDEDFPLDMMETMIDEDSFDIINFDVNAKSNKKPYEIVIDKRKDSIFCQKKGINNDLNITYGFVCKENSWLLVEITDRTD